ncbi:unnamed protein product [Didymodactylos carnosus]|uniref:ABC transporter domain-containing protein n=1 Tax=Didymodactylos carnosus TaxID=1234261 RepID=A0A815D2H8_9BILA|nr:unnamed protein product [Didymodactylos carnosus]CAF4096274.1 unnamed protein product [Didymodactylos carnosus]
MVLENLNLECKQGEMTVLVGGSGSGKSTLISLLERFYAPLSGRILLNNRDITTFNLRCLRSKISLVEQEPILFNTTIRENIAYGIEEDQRTVTDKESRDAARIANIDISKFSEGYNTPCNQLSTGEKQRVACARAIIRRPQILLLDEPTAALDSLSAETVHNFIREQSKSGQTCLHITHRLSTIQNDSSVQIAVVDYGQICEQGTYTELREKQGIFYRLSTTEEKSGDNTKF